MLIIYSVHSVLSCVVNMYIHKEGVDSTHPLNERWPLMNNKWMLDLHNVNILHIEIVDLQEKICIVQKKGVRITHDYVIIFAPQ